jgi:predicted Fe-S protein YdhL (DUF1289 family)
VTPTPFQGNLRSPCISICRIEPATGYCAGCHRTIEEIADWGMMTDERKRSVWQQIRLRRSALRPDLADAANSPDPSPGQAPDRRPAPAVTPAPGSDGGN